MKRNIKFIKNYLRPLKRDQRKVPLRKTKGNVRKTWSVMKKVFRKCPSKFSILLTKINVNRSDIFNAKKISDEFNNIFTNIRTHLANKIPNASNPFDSYVTKFNTSMKF